MEKEIIKHLFSSRSVGIFIHVNPDWDCFGSAMRCARSCAARA